MPSKLSVMFRSSLDTSIKPILCPRKSGPTQPPAPTSLPQRVHLPLQQAVLPVQRLPLIARHRGRHLCSNLCRALLGRVAANAGGVRARLRRAVCDPRTHRGTAIEAAISLRRPSPTEADWRLFPTLARFDSSYHGAFKCNLHRLVDYPNLWPYTRDLYQIPGIAETVEPDIYRLGYYSKSEARNPSGIVPKGPAIAFTPPHGRGD